MKIALHSVFKGRSVTIVGGGYSLEGFDFGRLRQPVIVCNYVVKYVPSEMVVCIDVHVSQDHGMGEALNKYNGHKICLNNLPGREDFIPVEISPNHNTLDLDWHIAKVNLSGFLAIAVALYLEAEQIFLLGFDGGFDDPNNPDWYPEAYVGPGQNTYFTQNDYFKFFSDENIINVGLDSRIDAFPKIDLNTNFYKIKKDERIYSKIISS